MKKQLTFTEVLEIPEAKRLVEDLESGSTDKDLIKLWKSDLYKLTGWKYK